jgi:hypothetical protein
MKIEVESTYFDRLYELQQLIAMKYELTQKDEYNE